MRYREVKVTVHSHTAWEQRNQDSSLGHRAAEPTGITIALGCHTSIKELMYERCIVCET